MKEIAAGRQESPREKARAGDDPCVGRFHRWHVPMKEIRAGHQESPHEGLGLARFPEQQTCCPVGAPLGPASTHVHRAPASFA